VFNANQTLVSGRKEKEKEIPPVAVPNNNNKSISLFMSLAVDKQY
jgi:hypothetical protein